MTEQQLLEKYNYANKLAYSGKESEAFKELQSLARNEQHIPSMRAVALCHLQGKGTDKSISYAIYWYKRVADATGTGVDLYTLATVYKSVKNYTDALKYFSLSHNAGYAQASYELALCYFNAKGTQRGYFKAITLFKEASSKGVAKATVFLEKLKEFESKRSKIKLENYNKAVEIADMLYSKNPYSYMTVFWEKLISRRRKRGIMGSWDMLDITVKKLTDGNRND